MPRTYDLTIPDLTGRRALVTGGSDGMGVQIVTRLAAAGADVLVPVRNRDKGDAVRARILDAHPHAKVALHDLDLASLASIEDLGQRLVDEGAPIHLVINNAGVMTPPDRRTTTDGFELQLGVNHLGHVALVGHLLPLLKEGRARITWQSSIAAKRGSINVDDPNWERSYDGMKAYRQSKIAVGMFGLELSRRSRDAGWGITSNVSHPGVAPTSLLAARPEMGRDEDTTGVKVIRWLSSRGLLVGTPETAALPALMAATSPESEDGGFYGPQGLGDTGGRPGRTAVWKPLRDEEGAALVWDLSQEMTGVGYA